MANKQIKGPRLTLELVPRTCWRRNLRRVISKEEWNNLRNRFEAFSGVCPVCGNGDINSSLHLHEVWHYDVKLKVQKLVKLQPICPDCHDAKHWGRAAKVGLGERATEHLAKVNGWDIPTTFRYIESEMEIHNFLSQYEYKLDVSLVNK